MVGSSIPSRRSVLRADTPMEGVLVVGEGARTRSEHCRGPLEQATEPTGAHRGRCDNPITSRTNRQPPLNNWPPSRSSCFTQHGKHRKCRNVPPLGLRQRPQRLLSEPGGDAQRRAAAEGVKRSWICGRNPCQWDSAEVLEVQSCLPSERSSTGIMRWE